MPILTLVTPEPQPDFDIWVKKSYPDIMIEQREILSDACVRWKIKKSVQKDHMDIIRKSFKIDLFLTPDDTDIKLFVADMDATIVKGETLDDMAEMAGIGAPIASITERAMRGELDFETALLERIKLLQGYPSSLIARALENLAFNKGAEELLIHLKRKGVYCILVSGGFTPFTSFVAEKLGFDAHYGNDFVMGPPPTGPEKISFLGQIPPLVTDPATSVFTGEVKKPILDKDIKLEKLRQYQADMIITDDQIMCIGDGANDLPMLSAVNLGVAYYGKPLLRDALINRIDYTDLRSLSYLV
tara:strand:+ start:1031 stop:1933 length:903 start_codon:yes stop_codon:yes gene_type:complete